jgi:hypothetical protein
MIEYFRSLVDRPFKKESVELGLGLSDVKSISLSHLSVCPKEATEEIYSSLLSLTAPETTLLSCTKSQIHILGLEAYLNYNMSFTVLTA